MSTYENKMLMLIKINKKIAADLSVTVLKLLPKASTLPVLVAKSLVKVEK